MKKEKSHQTRINRLALALSVLLVFSLLLFLHSHRVVVEQELQSLTLPIQNSERQDHGRTRKKPVHRLVAQHAHRHNGTSQRNSQQAAPAAAAAPADSSVNPKDEGFIFHYVFSSGCNALQDWQSYMFFYSMKAIGFRGDVTRVASCETEEAASTLRALHNEQIKIMSPRFHLHTTPDYTRLVPGPKYNFFNKPFGIRHFMEHGLQFPSQPEKHEKTIIVVLDPDQFLLRTFVRNMTTEAEIWDDPEGYTVVDKGQPMAQSYAFGGHWIQHIDRKELWEAANVSKSTSGINSQSVWNPKHMKKHYAVGPPYICVASDMYRIVTTWTDFVVPIYKQMQRQGIDAFMAEMYGYSSAAAHLNLPHRVATSFMLSNVDTGGEGAWPNWVDRRSSEEVCDLNMNPTAHVIHLCQRYFIGNYFISKYQVPKTPPDDLFFSCEHPLLKEPPPDVARKYDWALSLDGQWHNLTKTQRIRTAFIVCQFFPRLNAAATYYKDRHCKPGEANYSKVFVFETHDVKKERLKRERAARQAQRSKK